MLPESIYSLTTAGRLQSLKLVFTQQQRDLNPSGLHVCERLTAVLSPHLQGKLPCIYYWWRHADWEMLWLFVFEYYYLEELVPQDDATRTPLYVSVHGDPYVSTLHDIVVESAVMVSRVPTFSSAICCLFATHYILNLSYGSTVAHFYEFIQRGLIGIKETKKISSKVYNLLEKLK